MRSVQSLGGLVLCLALVGCSTGSSQADAHDLAIEACAVQDENFRDQLDTATLAFMARRVGASADLAAEAAAKEPEYSDFVRDLTSIESRLRELAALMEAHGEDLSTWPQDSLDQWQDAGESMADPAESVAAFCRIESAR